MTDIAATAAAPSRPLSSGGRLHRARLRFRDWRKTRPFWGGFWTLLGGALIAYVPGTALKFSFIASNLIWAGILVGALIGALGILVWAQPQYRYFFGIAIILLSLVSFFTSDFGGFFLGLLMGLIGGSLSIGWMPNPPLSRRERRRLRKGGIDPSTVDVTDKTIDVTDKTIDLTAVEASSEPAREDASMVPGMAAVAAPGKSPSYRPRHRA